jgi:hypothetical protein
MAIGFTNLFNSSLSNVSTSLIILIVIAAIWKLIWYGLAVYKTLERKQKTWFVVLFICAFVLNDLGILAIIYLLINKKKKRK